MASNPPDPRHVRTIVVRTTNWVGDVVMNTPFFGRLRQLFPQARIVALSRKSVAPLLQHHPDVDEALTIDDRRVTGYLAAVGKVRSLRAELGFALPNSLNAAALLRLGGVPARVGYDRDGRAALLTHPVRLRPRDLAVHEVQYYLRLLHAWESTKVEPGPLKLAVTPQERGEMTWWLEQRRIDGASPLVGVNPAAFYGTAKRWSAAAYADAALELARPLGAKVIVTGLEQERGVAHEVCVRGGPDFFNAAGEMTLRQLMAFLDRCKLYLTNDSGAMHIAAALGTPLVAVFGSTDWVTTAPLSPRARIVRVETECAPCLLRHCPIDHRCMTRVTPEMVIAAGQGLLEAPE